MKDNTNSSKPLCNLCGSQENRQILTFNGTKLYKCLTCKLIFTWPLPKKDAILNRVEQHYTEADPYQSVALAKNKFFNNLLDDFESKIKCKGKLLDVGCGYGHFMHLATERGWKSHGVEIMEKGCRYIKQKLNLPVFKGELSEADFPSESFDVVTLIDVLVICPNPLLTLQIAHKALKNEGIIAIRLRNFYFQYVMHTIYQWGKILFSKLGILNPSVFHLYSFTPATIKKMLHKAGFNDITVYNSYLTTGDPYRIIKGSNLAKIIKTLIYYKAQFIYYLSFKKLVWGPSILAIAKKRRNDKKIKILHIITRLDKGGSADNTLLSVLGLNKNIFQVELLSGRTKYPPFKLNQLKKQRDIRYIEIPYLIRAINPLKDTIALFQLYRFMKIGKYDIVHTHSSKAGLLGRIAARLAGVKHIIHTPHGHVFYGYYGKILSYLFILLERWAAIYSEKIITLTDAGKDEHIKYKIASKEKLLTIHSGIEFDIFNTSQINNNVKEEFGIDSSNKLIGTVARLVPIKGHQYLIKAVPLVLKYFPKTTFLLVGDGPLRKKLKNLAEDLGVASKIIFCGMREDIPRLINAIDLFILPSLNEGMGRVFVEAMFFGKPIISTKVGGIPEVVVDGVNGLLVPPAQPDALAEAICRLLGDNKLAKKMSANAIQQAKKYSHTEMILQLENLYKSLVYK